MFCSCANSYVVEILIQETPTKTWTAKVIKAHIYITSWRVGGASITVSAHVFVGVFSLVFQLYSYLHKSKTFNQLAIIK